jgi:hypothetical protein
MKVNGALSQTRIINRVHNPDPRRLSDLKTLCQKQGIAYPVETKTPVRFEIASRSGDTHYRNHPSRTYTLHVNPADPNVIIELLAFYAFEWEAQEIARKLP